MSTAHRTMGTAVLWSLGEGKYTLFIVSPTVFSVFDLGYFYALIQGDGDQVKVLSC